ncbi:hypothetical protein [Segetibacter koreensis]|uniref:hypothetical protein n=1 Tax=Segetibacter koreensis TaxID=398037 RepID=UPI00036853CD|nr:hypothetical protein [Segetibacter koreensis]
MNMQKIKNISIIFSIVTFAIAFVSWKTTEKNIISAGKQPEVTEDSKGIIRVVFGRNDSIFYSFSKDGGAGFSKEVLVAQVPKMHLGATRGPQIATSANYSVVTAIDKDGAIHWFLLNHANGKWTDKGVVNDKKGSAPEGLMGIAADNKDNFYAVWLDIRLNNRNNIYFSSLSASKGTWSDNKLVYQSPDEHTCECCKPNIAVNGSHVAIMFRNWLNGSRDLYCVQSVNSGKTFANAEKLGTGTWQLNGCPMDGGGITIDANNVVRTSWQREGTVYYSTPGSKEVVTGKGRSCSITSQNGKTICSYQQGEDLKIADLPQNKEIVVGKGKFLKSIVLADKTILCVWEQDNNITYRKI